MMKCPKDGCSKLYKNKRGVGVHWSNNHSGPPPWKLHNCDYCGASFERREADIKIELKFCDHNCYSEYRKENEWRDNNKKKFICDECGCGFYEWENRRSRLHTFCSPGCYHEWETVPGERDYGRKWENKRKKAIKRDRGTCTYGGCEKKECDHGPALHVHHIKPLREFKDNSEAHKLSNLRTLCAEHHRVIEKKANNG